MENEIPKALDKFNERIEALEARAIAADLMLLALMETHPDQSAFRAALERSLDPAFVGQSKFPKTAQAAQQRVRTLLGTPPPPAPDQARNG